MDNRASSEPLDTDVLAERSAEWISHATSASASASAYWAARIPDPNAPFSMGPDPEYLAGYWDKLAKSPLAGALYAMDLTEGERALARSAGHPLTVEKILFPGGNGHAPLRQDKRAQELGERLNSVLLFGSHGATSIFPTAPPFCGHGPSAPAAGMRKRRVAHLAGVFGSIAGMAAAGIASAALPEAGAHGAFTALMAGFASTMVLGSTMATFGKAPENFSAARIMRMAWPALSSKSSFKYINNRLSHAGEQEFKQSARPQNKEEIMALAHARPELLDEDPSNYPQEVSRWIAPYLASVEKSQLMDATKSDPDTPGQGKKARL